MTQSGREEGKQVMAGRPIVVVARRCGGRPRSGKRITIITNCIGSGDGLGRTFTLGWERSDPNKCKAHPWPTQHDDPRRTPFDLELELQPAATAMEDTTSQNAAAAAEQERAPSALALRRLADYATGAIPTVFYVPDFISHSEQSQLLHNVLHPPNPVSFYSFAFSPCFSRSYCI